MTNHIFKSLQALLVSLVSVFIISCTDGSNSFVPVKEIPEEEAEADILITGGAVKGPLISSEINIYKFELDQGPIHDFRLAIEAWFGLLDFNETTIVDDSITSTLSSETVISNIKDQVEAFGYVTELKSIKRAVNDVTSFDNAKDIIQFYISPPVVDPDAEPKVLQQIAETNTLVIDAIQKSIDTSATVSELKSKINDIESLSDQIYEADSFSAITSLLRKYRSNESNAQKINGFDTAIDQINQLASLASGTSLSDIRRAYRDNVTETFLNSFEIQNDPVARENISALKEELETVSSRTSAKELLEKFFRKEGKNIGACIRSENHDTLTGEFYEYKGKKGIKIKPLSWDEVFSMWRESEADRENWIDHYKSRGFNS